MFQFHDIVFGFTLGLYAAAIPGPINLEVVRRAITRGSRSGLSFGLGASTADATFMYLASLGAAALVQALPLKWQAALWFVGGAALLILGINGLRAKPPVQAGSLSNESVLYTGDIPLKSKIPGVELAKNYFLGLGLTLSSPPTIMFWVGNGLFIAGSRMTNASEANWVLALVFALSVAAACSLWVLFAVTLASRFRRLLQPSMYVWVERIAGLVLCTFACVTLGKAVWMLLKHS